MKEKVFKYELTVKILLKNIKALKLNVYFDSSTKTVINHRFDLDKSFQEILYRIDNWINENSGWIIEPIKSQCINISNYRSLTESFFIK